MLRSDRFHVSVVGLALFFAALAWLTTPNEPSALEVEGCPDKASPGQAYEVRDDTGWTRTLRVAPECEPAPSDEAAATEAEQSRPRPLLVGEADLLAQERVAHWTQWIGFFTAAGFAILYVTFLATRDAVEETRKIGEAQTRAYLFVKDLTLRIEQAKDDASQNVLVFKFVIQNNGKSPAFDVSALIGHCLVPSDYPSDRLPIDMKEAVDINIQPIIGEGTRDGEFLSISYGAAVTEGVRVGRTCVILAFGIKYRDVFNKGVTVTTGNYFLNYMGADWGQPIHLQRYYEAYCDTDTGEVLFQPMDHRGLTLRWGG